MRLLLGRKAQTFIISSKIATYADTTASKNSHIVTSIQNYPKDPRRENCLNFRGVTIPQICRILRNIPVGKQTHNLPQHFPYLSRKRGSRVSVFIFYFDGIWGQQALYPVTMVLAGLKLVLFVGG